MAARGGGCSIESAGNRAFRLVRDCEVGSKVCTRERISKRGKGKCSSDESCASRSREEKVLTGFDPRRVASDVKFKKDALTGVPRGVFGLCEGCRETQRILVGDRDGEQRQTPEGPLSDGQGQEGQVAKTNGHPVNAVMETRP